jgi:4-diphosphocytidyl-2-C-methyl-D-erythritol kinase
MSVRLAHAKLNLALVAGPLRPDGYHELATVFVRLQLADGLELEPAPELAVRGFAEDTLVRGALELIAHEAGVEPAWEVTIDKQIPVAAGLGGGSADAAAALHLANEALPDPLPPGRLHTLAAGLGADVPACLADGPQLGRGPGTELTPIELPDDYAVLLWIPEGAAKESTGAVFAAFDARAGGAGFEGRAAALEEALAAVRTPRDLTALPPNDLARNPAVDSLRTLGAFRADVTGAGPTVYGLFDDGDAAQAALEHVAQNGRSWLTAPC